jgi:hypothetical protein
LKRKKKEVGRNPMTRGKKPSREDIISGIREAYAQTGDLRHRSIQDGPFRSVYRSFKYFFPSWQSALAEAGFDYDTVKREVEGKARDKKRAVYIAELAQAYQEGIDLSAGQIQAKGNPRRSLYDRAKTYFSGRFFWHQALQAAGLPVEKIIRQDLWDREKVKIELLKRHESGLSLKNRNIQRTDQKLYKAISHHFDSYAEALRYSCLPVVGNVTISYSPEQIIRNIQRYNHFGIPLNTGFIVSQGDKGKRLKSVYYAGERKFGSWKKALIAAGLKPEDHLLREPWNKEKILERIRRRYESGESLNTASVQEDDFPLLHAASNHFGSWQSAIETCGLNYMEVQLYITLSPGEVIEGINTIASAGGNLDTASLSSHPDIKIRRLLSQGARGFGSWENALTTAGFDYGEIRLRRKPYTLDELAGEVRAIAVSGASLESVSITNNPETRRIHKAVRRRGFASWYDFLDSIGIDTKEYRSRRTDWQDGKGVLTALKKKATNGIVHAPTTDRNLSAVIRKYYGTVKAAVKAAGVGYIHRGKVIVPVQAGSIDSEKPLGIDQAALVRQARKGDENAFNILLEIYRRDIDSLVGKLRAGNAEEKRMMVYTSFFEMIHADKEINEDFRDRLSERVRQRIREEQPSWVSLDREYGGEEGSLLIDTVDDKGRFFDPHKL